MKTTRSFRQHTNTFLDLTMPVAKMTHESYGLNDIYKPTTQDFRVMRRILCGLLSVMVYLLVLLWLSQKQKVLSASMILEAIIAGVLGGQIISRLLDLLVKGLNMLQGYSEHQAITKHTGKPETWKFLPMSIVAQRAKGGQVLLEKRWRKYDKKAK